MSIMAIVVTHNRKAKALNCINAIKSQTFPVDSILIIDNASTDGTSQAISNINDPRIILKTQSTNLGGAAGFELGQELAYDAGYKYAWLCDDDCYPSTSCLTLLLSAIHGLINDFNISAGFAVPRVTTPWAMDYESQQHDRSMPIPFTDFARFYKPGLEIFAIEKAVFANILIPTSQFLRHGFSRGDYGIWYDDYEWTQRVSHLNPGIFVPAATALHDIQRPVPGQHHITDEDLPKHISNLRNAASHSLEKDGIAAYTSFCVNTMHQLKTDGVSEVHLKQLQQALLEGLEFKAKIRFPKDKESTS